MCEHEEKYSHQIKDFMEESNGVTFFFQKYKSWVMSFVISMPINCVILEVEVETYINFQINSTKVAT